MAFSLLLADDKPAIAKIISLSLPREEFVVESVTTGREALEHIENSPPHFLLLDVSLPYTNDGQSPEKDGLFLTRHIKTHPSLHHIKIILLTNAFEPVDEAKCREYKADGVLIKPFDPSELRSRLKSLTTDDMRTQASSANAPGAKNKSPTHLPNLNPIALDLNLTSAADKQGSGLDIAKEPKTRPAVPGEDLSPAAKELASFFAQEINTSTTLRTLRPPPITEDEAPYLTAPPPPVEGIELEGHDLSKAANEWKPRHPSIEADFSQWQSRDTRAPDLFEGPSAVFDTGDSSFEFSRDYLKRIGAEGLYSSDHAPRLEPAPLRAPTLDTPTPYAPISPPPAPPPPALSQQDMEAIVREEARRVCQDIVDKVAWEVIPELAENIIRRELEKVLQSIEQEQ